MKVVAKGKRSGDVIGDATVKSTGQDQASNPGVRRPQGPPNAPTTDDLLEQQQQQSPGFRAAYEDADARKHLVRCIADLREHRDLTQADFAEFVGTSQSAVSEFENGVAEPRIATVQRFARALGARIELQLWKGPILVLHTWKHRAILYREVVEKVSTDNKLARIWLHESTSQLPATQRKGPGGARFDAYVELLKEQVMPVNHAFRNHRDDGPAARFFDLQMADPAFRSTAEDVQARRQLIKFFADHRIRMKMSQARMASLTRTSQSAVSDFEKSVSEPRIATLQRWARVFGFRFEMQLWEGPFVLFNSWLGRKLPYETWLLAVHVDDHIAAMWHQSWRRQTEGNKTRTCDSVQVEQTTIGEGTRSLGIGDSYIRELRTELGAAAA